MIVISQRKRNGPRGLGGTHFGIGALETDMRKEKLTGKGKERNDNLGVEYNRQNLV